MNRHEFYDNLNTYLSLQHSQSGPSSNTNKYYAKLDKFYPDGRPRYFYSKAEWDAYQKNKKASQEQKKAEANKWEQMEREQRAMKSQQTREAEIQKGMRSEQQRQKNIDPQKTREAEIQKAMRNEQEKEHKEKIIEQELNEEFANILSEWYDDLHERNYGLTDMIFSDKNVKNFAVNKKDKKFKENCLKDLENGTESIVSFMNDLIDSSSPLDKFHAQLYSVGTPKDMYNKIKQSTKFRELLKSNDINPEYKKEIINALNKAEAYFKNK